MISDIDECAFDSPCQYECYNTPGSYYCSCPDGYYLNGSRCEGKTIKKQFTALSITDKNECLEHPCADDQLCFNHYGDYECITRPCPYGYRLENL
uniref:EGF-like domain-containing protein n=1 Tax=Syphacia muris TaxID=451379 RepID=A0A0N5AL86_9BILA